MKTINKYTIFISIILCFFSLPLWGQSTDVVYTSQSSGSLTLNAADCQFDEWNYAWTIHVPINTPIKFSGTTNTFDYFEIDLDDNDIYDSSDPETFSQPIISKSGIINIYCSDGGSGYPTISVFDITFSIDASYTFSQNEFVTGNSVINGNLGIGVLAPHEKLEVNGNIRGNQTAGAVKFQTDYGYILLGPVNSSWAHIVTDMPKFIINKPIYAQTGEISSYLGTNLSLQTYGTPRMTILNSNGNVGIGTTTPTQALSVTGRIAIAPSGTGSDEAYNGALIITKPQASGQYINFVRSGIVPWSIGTVYNSSTFAIGIGKSSDAAFTTPFFNITTNGNVGIGTTTPDQALTVKGKIHANEVIIDVNYPIADYVFKPTYKLMPLNQVEQYVKTNNHLPEILSAGEITKNGMSMGEMQNKLLQKIEELTLYMIEQQKTNNQQSAKIEELERRLK